MANTFVPSRTLRERSFRIARGDAGPYEDFEPHVGGACTLGKTVWRTHSCVGYGDLSCYGASRVHTPHLDKLAGTGVRLHERSRILGDLHALAIFLTHR